MGLAARLTLAKVEDVAGQRGDSTAFSITRSAGLEAGGVVRTQMFEPPGRRS